jgi:hypothetical protein
VTFRVLKRTKFQWFQVGDFIDDVALFSLLYVLRVCNELKKSFLVGIGSVNWLIMVD